MANSSVSEETPEVATQGEEQPRKIQAAPTEESRPEIIHDQIRRIPFRLVGNWLIGSTIVTVDPSSLIEGKPDVGREAVVTATRGADGITRASKIEIREPEPKPAPQLGYLVSPFGALAALTVFLPLTLTIYEYLPGYGALTIIMSEIMCVGAYAFAYMWKRSLWENSLKQSVRGARGVDMRSLALAALGLSVVLGFLVATGGVGDLEAWLPLMLAKFAVPPLKMMVFLGITFFFSIMAAMQYMAMLEERGVYMRPLYLRPHVDPVEIGMQSLASGLGIPAGIEWKIIERKRLPSGGVWFVLQWMETTVRELPNGERKEFVQEKRYEVDLGVAGQIIAYAERQ